MPHDSPWITTATGGAWPYLSPTPADVDFRAIALQLARTARWSGAADAAPGAIYSVAQHSVMVAQAVRNPDFALYALLHDAHEAFIGDIPTPMKWALDHLGAGAGVRRLADLADAAIFAAAGLQWPMPHHAAIAVAKADAVILATEKLFLMPEQRTRPDWTPPARPLRRPLKPWPWMKAAEAFLAHLDVLMADRAPVPA